MSSNPAQSITPLDEDERIIDPHDFSPGRNYWFFLSLAVFFLLLMAVMTVLQTQERHVLYTELAKERARFHQLKIEEERLILEQQTFSATPMVAERAVKELKMFYPDDSRRISINQAQKP